MKSLTQYNIAMQKIRRREDVIGEKEKEDLGEEGGRGSTIDIQHLREIMCMVSEGEGDH